MPSAWRIRSTRVIFCSRKFGLVAANELQAIDVCFRAVKEVMLERTPFTRGLIERRELRIRGTSMAYEDNAIQGFAARPESLFGRRLNLAQSELGKSVIRKFPAYLGEIIPALGREMTRAAQRYEQR